MKYRRSQRLRGAASGNPPTPPQTLPAMTRAKKVPRTRKAAIHSAEGSASENQSPSSQFLNHVFCPPPSHALIHIWLDPTLKILASTAKRPAAEPTLTMTMLREEVVNFLNPSKAITSQPQKRVANPPHQARSEKRKLEDAAESSNKRTKRGTAPSLVVETTESEETTVVVETTKPTAEPPRVKAPMIDYPVVMYDEDGNSYYGPTDRTDLMDKAMAFARPDNFKKMSVLAKNAWCEAYLRRQKERKSQEAEAAAEAALRTQAEKEKKASHGWQIPFSPRDSHEQQHNLQAQTPRRWGMGSIIGGAKNLLSSIRGTPAGLMAAQAPAIAKSEPAQAGVSGDDESEGSDAIPRAFHGRGHPDASLSTTHEHQESQEEAENSTRVPSVLDASKDHHKGIRKKKKSKGKKSTISKAYIFSAYQKDIDDEVARRVIAERRAENAMKHGEKRKRISPTRIPNPIGCSYGMDLDFFGSDSESGEETQTSDDSPSARPSKRARLSSEPPSTPANQILGNPHRAEPYIGTMFADPQPGLFGSKTKVVQPETSSATFSVPPETDSSSASETEITVATSNKGKAKQVHFSDIHEEASSSIASGRVSSSEPPKSAMKGSNKPVDAWQQQPPPRPNPSHAALPTVNISDDPPPAALLPASTSGDPSPAALPIAKTSSDTEALARARSQALRYTPARPSGLRAASRLSNSTIATPSDVAENDELFVTAEPARENEVTENSGSITNDGPTGSGLTKPAHENEVTENSRIITHEGQPDRGLIEKPPVKTSGNAVRHNEKDLARLGDMKVAAALAIIPEANLVQYTFPERGFSEDDGDPEVTRYLNATWGVADEFRAQQTFERLLFKRPAQQSPPSAPILPSLTRTRIKIGPRVPPPPRFRAPLRE